MDPLWWLAAGGVGIAAFLIAYKSKGPEPLPEQKPLFTFLPKYVVALPIPGRTLAADDSVAELEQLLKPIGFAISARSADTVRFSRGSMLGDFSVDIAKLDLKFPLPVKSEAHVEVSYGSFAAFDTGARRCSRSTVGSPVGCDERPRARCSHASRSANPPGIPRGRPARRPRRVGDGGIAGDCPAHRPMRRFPCCSP